VPAAKRIDLTIPTAASPICRRPKLHGADFARRLALGADRRHRRGDPAVHQPAFSLRFFIGSHQLNTEYFYLLIALMLRSPF